MRDQAKLHCALLCCHMQKGTPHFNAVCVQPWALSNPQHTVRGPHTVTEHVCVSCSLSQQVDVQGLSVCTHPWVTAHVPPCPTTGDVILCVRASCTVHTLIMMMMMMVIEDLITAPAPPVQQLTDAVRPAAVEVSHYQQRAFPGAQAVVCLMPLEPVQHTAYLRHAVAWPVRGALQVAH